MGNIAINGLGRIGKLVLRSLAEDGIANEIVLLNDPAGDAEQHAMLLELDSVHGRWRQSFAHERDALIVASRRMRFTQERRIEDLPLGEMGIDLMIDCTGVFKTGTKVEPYFAVR